MSYNSEKKARAYRKLLGAVADRGGTLLTSEEDYRGSSSKVRVRCSEEHEWDPIAYVTAGKRKSWCPHCVLASRTIDPHGHERLRKVVEGKGGTLLTTREDYKGSTENVHVRCNVGHEWRPTPTSLISGGTWCKDCANSNRTIKPERYMRLRKAVEDKGGILLTAEKNYKGAMSKVQVQCREGHEWYVRANHLHSDRWCPACAGKVISVAYARLCKVVGDKGGILFTTEEDYNGSMTKVRVRCRNGHEWSPKSASLTSGTWCPICSTKRDSEEPTYLYIYTHPENYAYVGITNDPKARHESHSTKGHNTEASWIAAQVDAPDYWEQYVPYLDGFLPRQAPRRVMERAERRAIRIMCKAGYKVTNKAHNPQWRNGQYVWELSAVA